MILDCPLSVSCPCAYFPPSFILAYIFIYPPFSRFSLKYIKSYKRAFITRPIFKLDFLENRNLDQNFIPIILLNYIPYWLTFDFPIPAVVWEFINCQSFRNKLVPLPFNVSSMFRGLSRKRCVKIGLLVEKIRPSTVFIGRKIERMCDDKSPLFSSFRRHYLTRDNIRDNMWRYRGEA